MLRIRKRDGQKFRNKSRIYPSINGDNSCNNIIINENIISILLNKPLTNMKPLYKIKDCDFTLIKYGEYENIININYNLTQLKIIAKFYNLKLSGNKDELKKRIYNYLYYSNFAIIIQKNVRSYFIKKYVLLHGQGFKKKSLCANDADFCTLDYLTEIPYNQFISIKDEENFIYGFDIKSLYNLYLKTKTTVENPFNKKVLHKNVYRQLMNFIKLSKLLNIETSINYEELSGLNETRKLEMKILTLFQTMDSLGNYTNISWFNNLDKYELIRFIRELMEIWNYRAALTQEVKQEICPPYGEPFAYMNIHMHLISAYDSDVIKKNALNIINEFINKGIDNDSRVLGSNYVLCALTLVSSEAAEALPWLYESVLYEEN